MKKGKIHKPPKHKEKRKTVMKKALLKDAFKEIKVSYKRFISILLMALLGVGFFAGLRATSPDMVNTIDEYFKAQNVYDIQVMSTLGLTDGDVEAIKNVENVESVYGTYSKDGLINLDDKEVVSKILCVEDINKPLLVEGSMPQNQNECVVEEEFLKNANKNIGDYIQIEPEKDENSSQESEDFLKEKEMKIVGTVESPLYISRDRGTSKLGSGTVDYYIYVSKDNINSDVYTEIYVKLKDSQKYTTSSSRYEKYVDKTKQKIEEIKDEKQKARYDELIGEANSKIQDAENELNTEKQNAEQQIKEAEGKIIDAKDEVAKIENPTWYILDRNQNSGYASFIQDTESIENLSMVFPIVFFAIAILVSLTSMTRMVEEERQEIGTLKALGYNKFHISLKYIIYSSLACIIGAIIGMNIGFQLLPRIVWDMYEMMYTMPSITVLYNYEYSTLGLFLIYICIVGATLYSILKELKDAPATLLRPKAPKLGKRVLLERITPIWKRLNFSQKVTIRNIFRYKKRFLMTIIGIFGCTSLILAGFGLKDSISKILPYQYEKIFNYDIQVSLKSALDNENRQELITNLKNNAQINEVVETYMISGTASKEENQEDIQIIVPQDNNELDKVIKLYDLKENKINLNEDGIVITDKLAQLINAKVGDTITVKDTNDVEKELKIVNIAENYISHYVYMSKSLYEKIYEENCIPNVLLIQDKELTKEQESDLSREIVEQNQVSTVTLTSTIMTTLDDTMNSLNYVVIILIVSAGLLAFVVLYNLSNVNISERIRELATIKVLGFYDKEVYSYINRETTLLTIIGIILGLGGGYLLNFYIIGTCEIDMLRFVKVIDPLSYLYAILITVAFTIIVNIFTYFALKKIDMIGSLKSVE